MTITEQLLALRESFAEWAQGYRGGTAEVASDPFHLFALLAAKPGAVRACLFFKEELKRGEHEEAGVVDRTFVAVISRGRGFQREPADSLIVDGRPGTPLFEIVEDARQLIRSFEFPADVTEVRPDVKRIELFPMPGDAVVDAYQIEFSIGCQLDEPSSQALGVENSVLAVG